MELVHTSAPRGLKAGSRGFTTVAQTKGMPAWLSETLERLSGYRFVPELVGSDTERHPIVYRHARLVRGSESFSVLSRIAPCPTDYSGRSNRIAHHLVLDAREQVKAGPAWLVGRDDLFRREWNEEPRMLDTLRNLPDADLKPARCRAWQRATGDAGWAGETLRRWLRRPDQPLYLRHLASCEMLDLLAEAVALLPPEMRWKLTFQTGVMDDVPTGITCALRCVPQIAGVRTNIRGIGAHNTLDLVTRVALADSECAEKARSGELIATATSASGGTRKISAAASSANERPGTAAALNEESEIADAPYELVSLEDPTLGDEFSAGPVARAPTPAVRDRRRRDLVMLAIGAVGAAVAMFAITVGLKLLRSPEATDPQEIPGTVVEQSREETGIADEQHQPVESVQVASAPATQPGMVIAARVTHESETEVSVGRSIAADAEQIASITKAETPTSATSALTESASVPDERLSAKPVQWVKLNRDDVRKIETLDFDPAVIISEDTGVLPREWLTGKGQLQVAWLAAADGSRAKDVPRWRFDDGHIVANPTNPMGDAALRNAPRPVLELKTDSTPEDKLRVTFRNLAESDPFDEVSGFCVQHPFRNRAILFLTNIPALDRVELEPAGANDKRRGRHYKGSGTVANWIPSKKLRVDKERAWRYERKKNAQRVVQFIRRDEEEDKVLFEAKIVGPLVGTCQLEIFIAARLPELDIPFFTQIRAALQSSNKKEQPQRSVLLRNVYEVPMIELVFPGRAEKKPTSQPSDDNPNSHNSMEPTR